MWISSRSLKGALTRPDLAPFRAKMDPAYKRIADYAGEDNVKQSRDIVEKYRKG